MRKNIIIILFFAIFLVACTEFEKPLQKEQPDQAEAAIEREELNKTKNEQRKEKNPTSLDPLTVHYLDVGQGDATLFQYMDGEDSYTILYDVGDWQGNEVVPYLEKEKIDYIDLIIISHPHADHIGQLEQIMSNFDIGEVWMSGNTANTELFQSAMTAVLESDADYDEPRAGDVFDIGPLELFVLHPDTLSGDLNEDSLSLRFTYGDVSFLFTGDAYEEQEQLMMQQTDHIQADFLQLGHHGSNTSSHPSFVKSVNPTYAIYSAGAGNSYGHPHEEVIQLFKQKGTTLYGTDVHGTIIVQTDGVTYDVKIEKEGKVEQGQKATDSNLSTNSDSKKSHANHSDCININEASKEELMQITQIGEARAEQIISLRPFQSVDDLAKINGIGDARLKEIKEQGKACLGGD